MMHDREKTVAAELRRRSRSAWGKAYDAHAHDVFGFVYHLTGGDRSVAEDICQETWLTCLDRIEQFDQRRGDFRGWLFAIARQRVALHFRRLVGKPATCSIHDDDSEAASDGAFPDEILGRIERADAVRAAMVLLAEDRRAALIAKYVEGLTVDQIAARTDRSAKAIESLLSRARAQMRGLLQWYFASSHEPEVKEPSDGRSTAS